MKAAIIVLISSGTNSDIKISKNVLGGQNENASFEVKKIF
jgi:hypothetical protein